MGGSAEEVKKVWSTLEQEGGWISKYRELARQNSLWLSLGGF